MRIKFLLWLLGWMGSVYVMALFAPASQAFQQDAPSVNQTNCVAFQAADCSNLEQFLAIRQSKCEIPRCQAKFLRSYCLQQSNLPVNSESFQACQATLEASSQENDLSAEEKNTLRVKYSKATEGARSAFSRFRLRMKEKQAFEAVASLPQNLKSHTKDTVIPLSRRGNITPASIKKWLRSQALVNKKLFARGCLTVTETTVSGAAVDKLFAVKYNPICLGTNAAFPGEMKLLLIIKKIKGVSVGGNSATTLAEREIYRLDLLRNNPKIRQISAVRDPRYPQLTFAEEFYKYPEGNGQMGVISLLHAAKGDALYDYVQDDSNPLAYQKAIEGFKRLGETLANFHLKFMEGANCSILGGTDIKDCKTMIHADLHPKNVFYDGKFIYFIDLETMQNDPRFFMRDLAYLYALPMLRWKIKGTVLRYIPELARNYKLFYRGFLEEYLKNITTNVRVRNQIKEGLREGIQQYIYRLRPVPTGVRAPQ